MISITRPLLSSSIVLATNVREMSRAANTLLVVLGDNVSGDTLGKAAAEAAADSKLLVHWVPPQPSPAGGGHSSARRLSAIKRLYRSSASWPRVDVRILMHGLRPSDNEDNSSSLVQRLQPSKIILSASSGLDIEKARDDYVRRWLTPPLPTIAIWKDNPSTELTEDSAASDIKLFKHVVLGGTFDRLHAGHKVLLAEALFRSSQSMTVGVTDTAMLTKKVLHELILPCHQRIADLRDFLMDCDPTLDYILVPIIDPFGPSIVDTRLEAIIGSEETKSGCEKVNELRREKGLSTLDVVLVAMEKDPLRNSAVEEEKLSSSSLRLRLLGRRLRPPLRTWNRGDGPYVIGLTGGSASGKTSIGKHLQALGASLVDCDKLGHAAYLPGTECFQQVVEAFGEDIVGADGAIDRRALAAKVFGNPDNKAKLESIVWPEIRAMAETEMEKHWKSGAEVVVLDAAVLLMANWHVTMCHQVWSCIISLEEAVKRIVARDGRTAQEAEARLRSQMPNEEVVSQSNVVFCSQWEVEYTKKQVTAAWQELKETMQSA